MKRKLSAAICATLLSAIQVAGAKEAPRYKLVAGSGYGVCESYLKHLNALPKEEPPLTCEVKFAPQYKDFTEPAWEVLDWQKHLEWIRLIELRLLYIRPVEQEKMAKLTFDEWAKVFRQKVGAEGLSPRLRRTQVILNERGAETVIAYDRDMRECERDRARGIRSLEGGSRYFVFTDGSPPKFYEVFGAGGTAYPSHLRLFKDKAHFMRVYPESWSLEVVTAFPNLSSILGPENGDNTHVHSAKHICRYQLRKP